MKRYIKASSHHEYLTVNNQKFVVQFRDGTAFISSIHPYDETEYHRARQNTDGTWTVYRDSKFITKLDSDDMTWGEVAKELLKLDKEAKLERTGGIW